MSTLLSIIVDNHKHKYTDRTEFKDTFGQREVFGGVGGPHKQGADPRPHSLHPAR